MAEKWLLPESCRTCVNAGSVKTRIHSIEQGLDRTGLGVPAGTPGWSPIYNSRLWIVGLGAARRTYVQHRSAASLFSGAPPIRARLPSVACSRHSLTCGHFNVVERNVSPTPAESWRGPVRIPSARPALSSVAQLRSQGTSSAVVMSNYGKICGPCP